MTKKNCWEIKKCNFGSQKSKTNTATACLVKSSAEFNNTNGGVNGGRICWAVAGTFSSRPPCGEFVHEQVTCMECEVFKQIEKEEENKFSLV